jgi:rod shape-determining protein MreB
MILAKLPAEVSAAIWHSGIYLSGGTCKIAGVDKYISNKLQMDVNLAEEPQMAVVLGGGKTVGTPDILQLIKIKD